MIKHNDFLRSSFFVYYVFFDFFENLNYAVLALRQNCTQLEEKSKKTDYKNLYSIALM